MTVTGSGFAPGAQVKWSGTLLSTSFQSDTQLNATVLSSLIAFAGKYSVTVLNQDGTAATGSASVSVNPVLSAVSPSSLPAGTNGTGVAVKGLGFSSNCAIGMNASGARTILNTSYGGPTTLSANIPASALNGVYPLSVFVTDLASGVTSQTLPIVLTVASVNAIRPEAVYALTAPFTVFVGGSNFVTGTKIIFNGTAITATNLGPSILGPMTLSGTVTADILPTPVGNTTQVGVAAQNPGAGITNSVLMTVYPSPYGSTITPPLVPESALVGGPAFTLTVNGAGFVAASSVYWATTKLATTYVSASQLTAFVPASLITINGVAAITVAAPGVNPSNSVGFPINAPLPAITSISPSTVNAGGPGFTLTINGSGFIPVSTVNGVPGATTTYVNATQLTVAVPAAAIAAPGSLPIQVANPGPIFSPQPVNLTVQVAAPVLTAIAPASVTAGGADVTLTATGSGFTANSKVVWNGTTLATSFVSATQLTALVPAELTAVAGSASITISGPGNPSNALPFAIATRLPSTSTAGIGNAASGQTTIAPGSLFSIYGTTLATSTASAATLPLPTSLGGSSVTVNGKAIPLVFVSAGQINAQLPFEIQPGTATLVIQSGTLTSAPVPFTVAATGPGVFTQGAANPTHAVALNLQDGTLNTAQTPAKPGQYVTAYLTGQGAVNIALATGAAAPGVEPFALPVAPVKATLGGQPVTIQFAGLAPTFVGLLQMNLLIPNVIPGEQTLIVTIGGVASAPVTLSIGTP